MQYDKIIRRGFWAALVFGMVLFGVLAPYTPFHWQDEVQICEVGRRVYEKTDWNLYMLPKPEMNTCTPGFWIGGPIVQESSYRLMGRLGPRISALFFLFAATVLLHFYLRRRLGGELVPALCSLLFFTAQPLAQSVRGARVDSVSFAWLFAALALFHVSYSTRLGRRIAYLLIGVSCGFCVTNWPTAVLLMPIVFFEFFKDLWRHRENVREVCLLFISAVVGGIFSVLLAIAPAISNLSGSLDVCRFFANGSMDGSRTFKGLVQLRELLAFPYIYAVGLALLVFCRRCWLLTLGAVGVFIVCAMSSHIYVFKTLYLLPYAVLGLGFAAATVRTAVLRRLALGLLVALTVVSYGRTVIVRNALGYFMARHYSFERQTQMLEAQLGRKARVYNLAWQTYFVGRELSWLQYRGFNTNFKGVFDCLDRIDHVLTEYEPLKEDEVASLHAHGFGTCREIADPIVPKGRIDQFLLKRGWLKPLGPYYLYSRSVAQFQKTKMK